MATHYNYIFDYNTNTYSFTTKNSIQYRIAFIVDHTFSYIAKEDIPNVFQIIIEKVDEKSEPFDEKVSQTVLHIIDQFFKKVQNSLVYVCSNSDERAFLRYTIFERWFKKSPYNNKVVKIDNIFQFNLEDDKTQKLYTSFLFHKENLHFEKLIRIYLQIEDALNSPDEK